MISEAVFTTLLGVVAGFVLSTLGQWFIDWRKERGEAESVRVILGLEIDTNIEALKQFWTKAWSFSDGAIMQPNDVSQYAQKFIDTPFPRFKREVLKSQMHLLVKSLDKQQIIHVFKIYDDLDMVEVLRNSLAEAAAEQRVEHARVFGSGNAVPLHLATSLMHKLGSQTQILWPQIENTIIPLLANDNPLKKNNKVSIVRRLHKPRTTIAKE
jgi:hypothetical protein